MRNHKFYVILPILLIIIILLACSKKDTEVVVNSSIKTDTVDKKDVLKNDDYGKQNCKTDSATKKIQFVSRNHNNFWSIIANNHIDSNYNSTKIDKSNIRIYKKTNAHYSELWLTELEKTYSKLKDSVTRDIAENLEDQYKAFNDYYDITISLYMGVISPKNNYNGLIDGYDTARAYYALADDVRTFTILLKEYLYLKTGQVDFYTTDKSSNTVDTYKDNTCCIEVKIINDKKIKDIIKDNYSKKQYCSIKKTKQKDIDKSEEYKDYWIEELDYNYNVLKKLFNKDDDKLLEKQHTKYLKYISTSKKCTTFFLKDTNLLDYNKDKIKIQSFLYEGQSYMMYNTLLIEYYYLLTGKLVL